MSTSHKASNLALHNRVCSIPEGGILFPFDSGLHGVDSAGNIIYPLDGAVATLRPGEGKFGSGAVAVEEGTENRVPGNIQAWSDYISQASTYSIAPVSTPYGSVVRLTGQSAGRVGKHTSGNINLDTSYATASIYFKPNVASGILTFYWDAKDDADVWRYGTFSNKAINLSAYAPGQWYRLVCTVSIAPNTFAGGTGFYVWAEGTFDVEIAAPQLEAKPFATSFTEGTRPDGILAYPISLADDHTIACYRKSHTDEDYKHVVKRSDGKVFVDGVEDSEYDIGWIAGRNLVLNSATEHTFTNTIFNKPLRIDTFQELIGEKLTLSFEAKAEAVGQKMDWYLRNVSAAAIISGSQHSSTELSAEYTRFSYTITLTDISNVTNLSFAFRATSTSIGGVSPVTGPVYVKNIKIERGSTATHWTPAPEDLGYDGDKLMLSNQTGLIDDLLIIPYAATNEEIKAWYHSNAPIRNNTDNYITL